MCRKSTWIVFFLAIIATVISVSGTLLGNSYIDGEIYESNYEGMTKDRSYARSLSGQAIDHKLIVKAVDAYSKIPGSDSYHDTTEYQTFARPYSAIYAIVRTVYNTESKRFNMEDFQKLSEEQVEQFYALRRNKQVQLVEATSMSDKAKEKVLVLDAKIMTPLIFSYTDGYTRFFVTVYTLGLVAAFAMAVCIAPIFSGEYAAGTDQLILTSRHGKNKLIAAKLFTGFSLAALICAVLTAVDYILSLSLFGSDGADAPLQLYSPLSPYPLTMGKTALILAVCTLFACLMTAAITMLLSAKFKSPFGVIILVGLLLIMPMFVSISERNIVLYNLFQLLPTNMMPYWTVTNGILYELLGLVIKPYVFMPIFAIVISMLLAPLAYRSFKKHQIG
nr:ABC transporter permease [Fusibacter paucivorans]